MGFVESTGGVPVEQTESALHGILIAFSAVPVVLMLAGLVILKAYNLDEESLQRLRQDTAATTP
jgi:Na+/melibiose symporter-like transporter